MDNNSYYPKIYDISQYGQIARDVCDMEKEFTESDFYIDDVIRLNRYSLIKKISVDESIPDEIKIVIIQKLTTEITRLSDF